MASYRKWFKNNGENSDGEQNGTTKRSKDDENVLGPFDETLESYVNVSEDDGLSSHIACSKSQAALSA